LRKTPRNIKICDPKKKTTIQGREAGKKVSETDKKSQKST